MTKVSSIAEARAKREFKEGLAQLDPHDLLHIPLEDVLQGVDTANESLADPVLLGPKAHAAVKRLYAEFGITSMPETIGELRGSLWYCRSLQTFSQSVSPALEADDAALALESTRETLRDVAPELLEPVEAYRERDTAKLREIHEKWMPLSRMAKHFDYDGGWRCGVTGPLRS